MTALDAKSFTSRSGRISLTVRPFHDSQHAEMVAELGQAIEGLDAMRRTIMADAGTPADPHPPGSYISTSCRHAAERSPLHDRCRLNCKWCGRLCRCSCHAGGAE